ncbi:uncharacterized, partial [Tachysurus ichikawai]
MGSAHCACAKTLRSALTTQASTLYMPVGLQYACAKRLRSVLTTQASTLYMPVGL